MFRSFRRVVVDASADDAKGSEAATRGCPSVGAESSTADPDQALFDMMEKTIDRYVIRGTKSMLNLDPKAPNDSDGKHVNIIPSDMITGPDPGRGQDIYHLAKLMNADFLFHSNHDK